MLFDTHAHFDDHAFDSDRDEVLGAMKEAGVSLIVDPASHVESARSARDIAEKYDFVYFAAGLHPNELDSYYDGYLDDVRGLCRHPKCVAVGEIGLDYHYSYDEKELQHKVFREQMALAREIGKPVIVHDREATQDVLGIITEYPDVRGVMHCFSGSWETAKTILDLGWNISFTGVVTFKNARRAVEVAPKIPLDRIMIETDSPYMAPEPVRGTRNDSRNVRYICRKIASLRGMSEEEFAAVTMENGKRFFGIK